MIHVGDNTWNLRVMITDLQVEKTLRVKGDLHIGGVMLKLSKTEGEFQATFFATNRMSQSANLFHDPNLFSFSQSRESREGKKMFKIIIFLLKITLKVTCVLVVVLILSQCASLSSSHEEKIVGEVERLRHVQGQRHRIKEKLKSVNKMIKSIDKKFLHTDSFEVNDVICIKTGTTILPFAPTQLNSPTASLCILNVKWSKTSKKRIELKEKKSSTWVSTQVSLPQTGEINWLVFLKGRRKICRNVRIRMAIKKQVFLDVYATSSEFIAIEWLPHKLHFEPVAEMFLLPPIQPLNDTTESRHSSKSGEKLRKVILKHWRRADESKSNKSRIFCPRKKSHKQSRLSLWNSRKLLNQGATNGH